MCDTAVHVVTSRQRRQRRTTGAAWDRRGGALHRYAGNHLGGVIGGREFEDKLLKLWGRTGVVGGHPVSILRLRECPAGRAHARSCWILVKGELGDKLRDGMPHGCPETVVTISSCHFLVHCRALGAVRVDFNWAILTAIMDVILELSSVGESSKTQNRFSGDSRCRSSPGGASTTILIAITIAILVHHKLSISSQNY
ncbi:hypothetical protein B0H19DRAFT_1071465 [Mycena capillaripes]|nr:hypothetical protein B0H19DRAFT_1071465 [Mycena capillaripes]